MSQLRRWFYSWLAEKSHRLSDWAVRRAYMPIQRKANEVSRYGVEADRQTAIAFESEWQQHEPMSLCRRYGIEQERYYRSLADNSRKDDRREDT